MLRALRSRMMDSNRHMMTPSNRLAKTLLASLVVLAMSVPSLATPSAPHGQEGGHGVAVSFPWVFQKGTPTARQTAQSTAEEIARKADYASVPADVAAAAWTKNRLPTPRYGSMPSRASLVKLGKYLKANTVTYGSVAWHTRSIWVNAGPKTISTATVSVYVLDVASGKVVYSKRGVKGRSDEKSNGYKIAAAILFTPLVTAVSGGPATPREQRASQIALGLAFAPWVKAVSAAR
ncbi:MAG: hypothetical protein KIS66_01145 [Fimbriimonadaceae bacterium]|nr:hypothetical protein [Fimbriimonadaceae bacterium]